MSAKNFVGAHGRSAESPGSHTSAMVAVRAWPEHSESVARATKNDVLVTEWCRKQAHLPVTGAFTFTRMYNKPIPEA